MKLIPDWILWPKGVSDLPEPTEASSMEDYYARRKARDKAWAWHRIKMVMTLFPICLVISSLIVRAVVWYAFEHGY